MENIFEIDRAGLQQIALSQVPRSTPGYIPHPGQVNCTFHSAKFNINSEGFVIFVYLRMTSLGSSKWNQKTMTNEKKLIFGQFCELPFERTIFLPPETSIWHNKFSVFGTPGEQLPPCLLGG
jgi:hypothetical protein